MDISHHMSNFPSNALNHRGVERASVPLAAPRRCERPSPPLRRNSGPMSSSRRWPWGKRGLKVGVKTWWLDPFTNNWCFSGYLVSTVSTVTLELPSPPADALSESLNFTRHVEANWLVSPFILGQDESQLKTSTFILLIVSGWLVGETDCAKEFPHEQGFGERTWSTPINWQKAIDWEYHQKNHMPTAFRDIWQCYLYIYTHIHTYIILYICMPSLFIFFFPLSIWIGNV